MVKKFNKFVKDNYITESRSYEEAREERDDYEEMYHRMKMEEEEEEYFHEFGGKDNEQDNEQEDDQGLNESNDQYPVTVKLELPIHIDTVESVKEKMNDLDITCDVETVLEHFFMYQSGFEFDNTYDYMTQWIEENRDDLQDL